MTLTLNTIFKSKCGQLLNGGEGQLGMDPPVQEAELPVHLYLFFLMNTYSMTYLKVIPNVYSFFLFFV